MILCIAGTTHQAAPLAGVSLALTSFEELIRREAREFAEHAGRDLAKVQLTPRHLEGEVSVQPFVRPDPTPVSVRPVRSTRACGGRRRMPGASCSRPRPARERRCRSTTSRGWGSAGRRPGGHGRCSWLTQAGLLQAAGRVQLPGPARIDRRQAAFGRHLTLASGPRLVALVARVRPTRLPSARPPPSGLDFTRRTFRPFPRNRSRARRRRGPLLD
jgi:hypothetical protein